MRSYFYFIPFFSKLSKTVALFIQLQNKKENSFEKANFVLPLYIRSKVANKLWIQPSAAIKVITT